MSHTGTAALDDHVLTVLPFATLRLNIQTTPLCTRCHGDDPPAIHSDARSHLVNPTAPT